MKRTALFALALALSTLAPPSAEAAGTAADAVTAAPVEPSADVPTIRESSAQLAALGPADRAQASASLRFLTASCPYTRAAMLLTVVLHDAVQSIPHAAVSAEARAELVALQGAMALQLRALEGLGLQIEAPAPGGALFGQPAASVPSRAALRQSADPIAQMSASIAGITLIAEGIEADTQAQIEAHSARLEALTGVARPCPRGPWAVLPGQPWTMGMQLNEAHDALVRLAPEAVDAEARAQIDALIGLLDALGAANQASRPSAGR